MVELDVDDIDKMSDEQITDLMDKYGHDGPDLCTFCEEVTDDPLIYYWKDIVGHSMPGTNVIYHEEYFCSKECFVYTMEDDPDIEWSEKNE